MHNVDKEESGEQGSDKNRFADRMTGYLKDWDSNNAYSHKIILVSIVFVLITGFLVYRLTVSIDDRPFYVNQKGLDAQQRRMSDLSRKTDSLDRIEEIIEMRKTEQIREYLNEKGNGDSLDLYELLNENQ